MIRHKSALVTVAHPELAQKIAEHLNTELLDVDIAQFQDGDNYITKTIKLCFIVQPTSVG